MKPLNLIAACLLCLNLYAQMSKPLHSENLSLGVGNALYTNGLSGVNNPAAIHLDSNRFRLWTGYSNYYLIKELNQLSVAAQFRIGSGGIGFSYSNLGWGSVHQHQLNLAYGLQVAKGFRIGIGVNYVFIRLGSEKMSQQGVYPGLGMFYNYKKFKIAFSVDNPIAIPWIQSKEKLPIGFDFGFLYQFTDNFFTCLEMVKILNTNLQLSLGFEYVIKDRFKPRVGLSIMPLGVNAGIGFEFRRIAIGLAFWYGHSLGPISHFDMTYEN